MNLKESRGSASSSVLSRSSRKSVTLHADPQMPSSWPRRLADHEAGLLDERDLAGFTVARDSAERRLVAWLEGTAQDGSSIVQVRRYRNGFLHGKAYIVESDLGGVLAGSSNLTYAGLMKNRELNLGYPTGEYVRLVRDWFEELWEESEPFDLTADLSRAVHRALALDRLPAHSCGPLWVSRGRPCRGAPGPPPDRLSA